MLTLVALAVLAGGGQSSWAGLVGSMEKVRPGRLPPAASSARLLLARGECEGAQVVIQTPARGVVAEATPLRGEAAPIRPRLYREAFVRVRTPSNGMGEAGLWPDPLVPVEDAYAGEGRRALPHDSTLERPLVLYVEVCAPRDQPEGRHEGEILLQGQGLPELRLRVVAEVLPFALPATSSLETSFGLSGYSLARGHRMAPRSAEAGALLREYATALLAHRLSAHGMSMDPPPARWARGELSVDFAEYDREMAPFLDGTALPSGARFNTADVRDWLRAPSDEARVAYYRAFRDHFLARGWKARLFFYAKDEPRPEDHPLVLAQSIRARKADLPVLVTGPADESLIGAADILCPNLNCFFPRPGLSTCRNVLPAPALRPRLGGKASLWWYQSCSSHGCNLGASPDPAIERAYRGWASYMIDHPAALNRAMGPLAYLAGIGGELYFDTAHAYASKDPWEDLFEFGGNGDGTLFYPGTPERIGGQTHVPIESLRLKQIRDGLEDYEYLLLAERLGDKAIARRSAERLARSGYEIALDPQVWASTREGLARRITALATNTGRRATSEGDQRARPGR
ncbi:MAG: DUF4091 domain-containing protein [Myxococcales bacterium]|nr:DUF4091 domain-containing protein [Myxococcales bacterium]